MGKQAKGCKCNPLVYTKVKTSPTWTKGNADIFKGNIRIHSSSELCMHFNGSDEHVDSCMVQVTHISAS